MFSVAFRLEEEMSLVATVFPRCLKAVNAECSDTSDVVLLEREQPDAAIALGADENNVVTEFS